MITYRSALSAVEDSPNIPNWETHPGKFITWAEDICYLLSVVYEKDFDTVTEDLKESLGIGEEDESDE